MTMPHTTASSRVSTQNSSTPPKSSSLPQLAELSRIVNQVVASWHTPGAATERRGWHRARYDRPAILTPMDEYTGKPLEVHQIVSGRDISPSGFSFTHLDPLACRRAIITFAYENEPPWDAIVLRLSWCRFTLAGIYQSGGKFLGVTASPLLPDQPLDQLPHA